MNQINTDAALTALVTGASSGIGKAVATALIDRGYRVICTGRRSEPLNELVAELGTDAFAATLDITNQHSVDTFIQRLEAPWRSIDILINNAGQDVGGRRLFHEGTISDWASTVETNLIGTIRITRALIDTLRASSAGHIINVGSTAGLDPYATGTIYAASKHGLHGFSESLRKDYAGSGLRVSEILPGMVRTGFAEARWRDAAKAEAFYDDYGTCLEPEDVARVAVFMLEQPKHVTISQLVILPDN